MIFCTLFNWLYLPQGIALYRSIARNVNGEFTLYVLCMDDFTLAALRAGITAATTLVAKPIATAKPISNGMATRKIIVIPCIVKIWSYVLGSSRCSPGAASCLRIRAGIRDQGDLRGGRLATLVDDSRSDSAPM